MNEFKNNERAAITDVISSKMGVLVFWVITFFCIGFAFLTFAAKLPDFLYLVCMVCPLVLIFSTFVIKVSQNTQSVIAATILVVLCTAYGMIFESIGTMQGAYLAIMCFIAMYQYVKVIVIQMFVVMGINLISIFFFPEYIFSNISSVFDLVLKIITFCIGSLFIIMLIKLNNRQMLIATRKTQNVKYLLKVVEIKKDVAEAAVKTKFNFLANMSHEIRTPLNAICGMSELLKRSELSSVEKEYVKTVATSADNLLSIVNDILDFSKIDSGKMELVEEKYFLENILDEVQSIISARLINKNIAFTVNIAPDVPKAMIGDELRIKQILLNLLGNAVKFTSEGCISVIVECGEICSDTVRLRFEISDTGIGIKNEDKAKLFSEFTQVDMKKNRRIQGTGLGLTISKRLAEMMGGDIRLDSVYGKGTTFTVYIEQKVPQYEPCFKKPEQDIKFYLLENNKYYRDSILKMFKSAMIDCTVIYSQKDIAKIEKDACLLYDYKTAKAFDLSGHDNAVAMTEVSDYISDSLVRFCPKPITLMSLERIMSGGLGNASENADRINSFVCPEARLLVVDDNFVNLKVAEGLLKSYEAEVVFAQSGEEAVKYVKSGEKFDIIFMDHMMPVMDGVMATKLIRMTDKKVPVIALTANVVKGVEKDFMENGMNDFISKPIDIAKLSNVMYKWIPKEKQHEAEQDVKINMPMEELRFYAEEIDTKKALANFSGDYAELENIIGLYYTEGVKKLPVIEKYLSDKDYKSFTIEIHSLKSLSAGIGAYGLSEKAKQLEFAGKEERYEYIDENVFEFMEQYKSLLGKLEKFGLHDKVKAPSDDAEQLDKTELLYKINEMRECMDNFDLDAALKIADELLKTRLSDKEFETLKEIRSMAMDFMYEETAEALAKFAEDVEKGV